jgi:hypothetical protein
MATVARAPIAVAPNISMSQSGLMVAALIGGFVVFVAMQGKLSTYWSILLGGGASAATPGATPSVPGASSSPTTSSSSSATNPFGLPSSIMPSLGGTANPFAAATGGTGASTPTGIPGLPNVSMGNFFGLGS